MAHAKLRQNAWLVVALVLWAVLAILAGATIWVGCLLIFFALAALSWVVARRGNWRLIGPHSYYDLIRMARKGRTSLFRMLFLFVVFGGIGYTYYDERDRDYGDKPRWIVGDDFWDAPRPRRFSRARFERVQMEARTPSQEREYLARLNSKCLYAWFVLQNVAILVLAPAYLGGAIAEERERGTLQLLFASQLFNREIVVGKLVARLAHLGAFLLAGLPVICIMQVWGGVDFALLIGNWINSVLLLVSASSLSLAISALANRAIAGVVASYCVVLVPGTCCAGVQSGIPLVLNSDFISPAAPFTPSDRRLSAIGVYCTLTALGLGLATWAVRRRGLSTLPYETPGEPADRQPEHESQGPETITGPCSPFMPPLPLVAPVPPGNAETAVDGRQGNAFPWPPLPPLGEHALLWKERYSGRRILAPDRHMVAMGASIAIFLAGALLFATILAIVSVRPATYPQLARLLTELWSVPLRMVYVLVLGYYVVELAFRAASSVVRERQLQTLDTLLLIPVDRGELLAAKWLGTLLRSWPLLAVCAGNVLIGTAIGVYHPHCAYCLLLFPTALIVLLCSMGLLLSIVARTVLQANLAMATVLLCVAAGLIGTEDGRSILQTSFIGTWSDPPVVETSDMLLRGAVVGAMLVGTVIAGLLATIIFNRIGRR